jgi:sulfatase modifying factor 1
MKKTALLLVGLMISLSGFAQTDLNIQMIFVKGASFFMGSDDPHYRGEEFDNERPVHRVSLGSYYIGKYEVTNGMWRRIMGTYPPAYNGIDYGNKNCDNCPVVKISFDDALDFIRRLNEKYPGKHYRLPTETEWEYAARGGKYGHDYMYSGSNKLNEVAWYGHKNGTTHPGGEKEANELSIYDMAGNVQEWCTDWYGEDYYTKTIDEIDPKGPKTGTQRVLRGGSFFTDDATCRSTYRSRMAPDTKQWDIGFRLAEDY